MVIDGEEKTGTLFSMVKATLPKDSNSIIAYHDNSSSLRGFNVARLSPHDGAGPSSMEIKTQTLHPILTAGMYTCNYTCTEFICIYRNVYTYK
jgi:phosphoribosylformylglycinamidine synthase